MWFLGAATILGCGGGGLALRSGTVTGLVVDEFGANVRGASVFTTQGRRAETLSNSGGTFVLQNVDQGEQTLRAEITVDGVRYVGVNVAQVFPDETAKSVNIALYPATRTARLSGRVRDGGGRNIVGARVFARQNDGAVLTSAVAITDGSGRYTLEGLRGDLEYFVLCNAGGFGAQTVTLQLAVGVEGLQNFVLPPALDPLFAPPANVDAFAWTTPLEPTRSRGTDEAYEALKRMIDPRRNDRPATRVTIEGDPIEVDLYWDVIVDEELLGYGVYRTGPGGGALTNVTFLRDPLAEFYADLDPALVEGTTYTYAMTAINASYPDGPNGESDLSDSVSVQTLGTLDLGTVSTAGGVRFDWAPAEGAADYTVYVFDRYPAFETTPLWSSPPTTATALDYAGPALVPGRLYYYVILGESLDGSGRTLSRIGEFRP
jgi:hypothetical protein